MHTHEFRTEDFTRDGFWAKLAKQAKKAGHKVIETALGVYYITVDDSTPGKVKAIGAGALAYFISPIDLIPDVMPVVGYSDDMAVLAGALVLLAPYFTDEIRRKANATMKSWFD